MSHNSKTVTIVVVVLVVVIVGWVVFKNNSSVDQTVAENTPTDMSAAANYQNSTQNSSTTISSTNTSDQALDQDMASVDAQMKGLDADNTAASQTQ